MKGRTDSRWLSLIVLLILGSQVCVFVVSFATILYGVLDPNLGHEGWAGRVRIIGPALSSLGYSAAAFGTILTLLASFAPRWLAAIGIGPRLRLHWQQSDGYRHKWNREFKGQPSPGVIVRMQVRNDGPVAAESVQVIVENIYELDSLGNRGPVPLAKYASLRWANSYDLDKFERLEIDRCDTVMAPLIHADSAQFIDFGFVIYPGSPFYTKFVEFELLDTGAWCFHPFYQWLPAREDAVLKPGKNYQLALALTAKNSRVERYRITVQCAARESLTAALSYDQAVGNETSSCPIKIRVRSESEPSLKETPSREQSS